ncbi:C4-dicarboxylate TRAP transporter large permease protein DctM [Oligella urethralis]|uniref:TRAP transporter large permease n=1 Tax=Oligella urethralis TaxID=90245 RepID=UPI002958674C|nr:TRAP transporter large permease subunit [Oligella urethralis]WOS36522.1 C4-dicarboxylate TRAP transporter large permease protein DctM [Oligella urethralis]
MSEVIFSFILVFSLIGALALGVWVSVALFLTGIVGILLFSNAPLSNVLATNVWSSSSEWSLAALPLFIWMGEILFRSRIAGDLFNGLAPWMRRLPGCLSHVGIVASGIFAAVSGSSAATCATVAKVTLPELKRRGYDEKLTIGTIAGSGTLGLLIPPSIIMIVYGVAADVSITRLFVAGIIPGLLMIALFMSFVAIWSILNPSKVPQKDPAISFIQKIKASGSLIPVTLLIIGIMGSIYLGIASPTDSAAVGVVLSLMLVWLYGDLNWQSFKAGLFSAVLTSSMIAFILAGAAFLTVAMGYSNIPMLLAQWITELGLNHYALIAVLALFFVIMGCFLDGISIVVLTTSILLPSIQAAGIDPLWFGLFLVLVVEMAQITPPVGLNLFVLQGMTGKHIWYLSLATLPFFLMLLLGVILITVFPEIVMFLPKMMYS